MRSPTRLASCRRRGLRGEARSLSVLLLSPLILVALGCTPTPDGESSPSPGDRTVEMGWMRRLDEAVDSGHFTGDLLRRAIQHPDPFVRREAARAIGVLRPPEAVALLTPRISRPESHEVRCAALQSLALLRRGEAYGALRTLVREDPVAEIRRLAVFAVGRLEGDGIAESAIEVLIDALSDPSPLVRGEAALSCWHTGEAAAPAIEPLIALLGDPEVEVRWRAAYGLMRIDDPRTVPPLVPLLSAGDERERTFAAWGLRQPIDPDREELLPAIAELLRDPRTLWTARVEALRTLGAFRAEVEAWAEPARDILLAELMRDRRPAVQEVLLEALASGGGEIEAPFILAALERTPDPTVRRAAAIALARCSGDESLPVLEAMAGSEDPLDRTAAATALGIVGKGGSTSLASLLRDLDPRVRTAAVSSIGSIEAPFRFSLLRTVLEDPDLAVRATVAEVFAKERPPGWDETLVKIWWDSGAREFWELRGTILEKLAESSPDLATVIAEAALEDPFRGVRTIASRVLGVPMPDADRAPPPSSLPYARLDDRFEVDAPVRATIRTARGSLVVELDLEAAPRHVSGFVATALEGGYDGLHFHRVVPSFVVQGADPRGDGWGDSGYHLVDEIHPESYHRGSIGMPKLWDHTGGSQLFITHLPTPHLDGRYTIFGRVIEGLDTIDLIRVGDQILEVRVDPSTLPGGGRRRASF
ncbi:MAG: HEAT repeat domain-containing protein [Planctomycetota bacterium]